MEVKASQKNKFGLQTYNDKNFKTVNPNQHHKLKIVTNIMIHVQKIKKHNTKVIMSIALQYAIKPLQHMVCKAIISRPHM